MGLYSDYTPEETPPAPGEPAPAPKRLYGDYEQPAEGQPVVPNKPFGELKPYTPSWREWIGNLGQDALMALGMKPYDAGHIAHGARDAAMLSPAGAVVSALDVPHYAGKGDYTNAAINALSVIPAGRYGVQAAREGVAAKPIMPNFAKDPVKDAPLAVPSDQMLKESGVAGFTKYRDQPLTYPNQGVNSWLDDITGTMRKSGQYRGQNPSTYEAVDELKDKIKKNPFITPADIDEFRLATGEASKARESGAMTARTVLFDKLEKQGDTIMRDAVKDYGAGKRGEIVTNILSKSASRKDTDQALANQLRSTVENQSTRLRGYNEAEVAALDKAREGSKVSRGLNTAADVIGGSNLAGRITRAGVAGGLGAFTGPAGPAFALVPETVAGGIRLGTGAARRSATEAAGDLVRMRSPMYQDAVAAALANPTYGPSSPSQTAVVRNAIAQALAEKSRDPAVTEAQWSPMETVRRVFNRRSY